MLISHTQPWHIRSSASKHEQWFKNLVDLHELTNTWLRELQVDRPSHLITRGLSKEITENLWMLDSLANIEVEGLLDDTRPDDTLGRLEHTIWAVQGWTLTGLLDRAKNSEQAVLKNILEQAAWKLGRQSAETRWPSLGENLKQDIRSLLLAFVDSPISGYPHSECFLVRRALAHEVQVEMRWCPHQAHFPEVKKVADDLCVIHSHWMRGFAYALNSKITIERIENKPRCIQRWFLMT